MKIAIVSAVYPPEPMVDAQTSSQLAEELARKGHSVQVYAPFPNRPAGKLFDGYRRTLFATSTVSPECTLTHCLSSVSPKSTMPSRFVENLSFGVTAGLRLLCDERPDVIYSNTWPIIASGIVAIIAVLRRIPLVLSVQDAYPESLASQKRMKNSGWCYKLVRQCDRMISHSAKEVIVISQRFRELYESDRGVDPAHLHMVLNWSDEKLFVQDRLAAALFRQKLGIPKDAFVAVCAGNIGVASDAEILVDAFARLKDRSHVYLLLAGDGARLGVCREKVEKEQLDRVIIHSPWKTDETAQVLQMADVLMLPTRGRQSLASIPSKLIGYLL
jgi:glycosyltransferase involved in cell wall biosynthesis